MMRRKSNNINLSASMMCADLANLEVECLRLEVAKIDRLHFDIMDGRFVKNIELGFSLIKKLKRISNLVFECHLMVLEPEKYIDLLLKLGIEYICIHPESIKEIKPVLKKIRVNNCKAGIVINPETNLDRIVSLLPNVDQVTFMTVSPGFAGQSFKPGVLKKIRKLKNIIEKKKYKIEIGTDGNMNKETIPAVVRNGANVIVLGSSSLFCKNKKHYGYKTTVNKIRKWTYI